MPDVNGDDAESLDIRIVCLLQMAGSLLQMAGSLLQQLLHMCVGLMRT